MEGLDTKLENVGKLQPGVDTLLTSFGHEIDMQDYRWFPREPFYLEGHYATTTPPATKCFPIQPTVSCNISTCTVYSSSKFSFRM